jgi:hypothetical protein
MSTKLTFKLFLTVFALGILLNNLSAQDMKKPDPVKNATLEMLMGTWNSEPYDMMGSKWSESANHYMKYGQFLCIEITGKNDKGESYNGIIMMKPQSDGSFTGWAFDDWGSVTTYTGNAKDNKISVTGKSEWATETREIEINGNTMVHKMSWTMKDKDGKDMNMNQTITYHKQ